MSATTEEIAGHGYVLTPGRYVGAEALEEDDEPFEEKMGRLSQDLQQQFSDSLILTKKISASLEGFGIDSK